MQSFESALVEELKTIIGLGDRIYPLTAPESVVRNGAPYLIYVSSEGLRDKSLDGYLDSKAIQVELNILAARYKQLKAITKQVVALLMSFEGRRIGKDGPLIEEVTYQMPVEVYEPQPALYRCVIEFIAYLTGEG